MNNLEFLRNNPHFQQLRQLVQQQPQMLEPILQQVGDGNPGLAQLIGQNQEQFLQLLSEDIDDDSQVPPGTHTIAVTEEERDAIERVSCDCLRMSTRLLTKSTTAVSPWVLSRCGDPGVLCLRQERGTCCQLPLRTARG